MPQSERAGWPVEAWRRAQSVVDGIPSPDARQVMAQNRARGRVDSILICAGLLLALVVLVVLLGSYAWLPDWLTDDDESSGRGSYIYPVVGAAVLIVGMIVMLLLQRRQPDGPNPMPALLPSEQSDVRAAIEGVIATHSHWHAIVVEAARHRASSWTELITSVSWVAFGLCLFLSTGNLVLRVLLILVMVLHVIKSVHVTRRVLLARSYLKTRGLPLALT